IEVEERGAQLQKVRSAESRSVNRLQRGFFVRMVNRREAWVERWIEVAVLIVAHAAGEVKIGRYREITLQIDAVTLVIGGHGCLSGNALFLMEIIPEFRTQGYDMAVQNPFVELQLRSPPFTGVLFKRSEIVSGDYEWITDFEVVAVVIELRGYVNDIRETMRIFQGGVAALIRRFQAWIVESRKILGGWIFLFPIDVPTFQSEVFETRGTKKAVIGVAVLLLSDTVVLGGRVELLVKQFVRTCAVVIRPGEQQLQTIR